ncbi:hypothetical protein FRC04_004857 [Tulasnella sp. 424]|nr:hypothetical protein FRC04_004857 [Tulasnella sp. 424]
MARGNSRKNRSQRKPRQQYALCLHCNKRLHRNTVRCHQSVFGVPRSLAQAANIPSNYPQNLSRSLSPLSDISGDISISSLSTSDSDLGASGDDEGPLIISDDADTMANTNDMEGGQNGLGDEVAEESRTDGVEMDTEPEIEANGRALSPANLEHPVDLLINAASSSSEREEDDMEQESDWESELSEPEEVGEETTTGEWPIDYGVSALLPMPMQAGRSWELDVARAVRREGVPEGSSLYEAVRAYRFQIRSNIRATAYRELGMEYKELNVPSLKVLRRLMKEVSGIEPKMTDCCRQSCICYTSDLAELQVCPICGLDRYLSDGSPGNQMLHIPLAPQLAARFAGYRSARAMRYRSEHERDYLNDSQGTISDIYDSSLYRSLRRAHPVVSNRLLPHHFFDDPRDVLLVGLTDGFQIFRRGSHTAWPVMYINANLSPAERYKDENLIIVGLIPGANKPKNFNSFQYVFAEELVQGAVGSSAYDAVDDDMFVLRYYAPYGGGDMPAVAAAYLNSKGHNAKRPCRGCDIEGVRIEGHPTNNKTHYLPIRRPRRYPPSQITSSALPLRDHQRYLQQAKEVDLAPTIQESKRLATAYGINGVPMSSNIPGVRYPDSFPTDLMHMTENQLSNLIDIFSGDFKKLDSGSEDYILPKGVWEEIGIATVEANATIPSAFGRKIGNVAKSRTFFTAESYLVWSTLYAPILLRGRFSKSKYYDFFCRTISIIERCMAFKSTKLERDKLRDDIRSWYDDYEKYLFPLLWRIQIRNAETLTDDDYTLLAPRKVLQLSGDFQDLRRRIAIFLSTQLEVPVKIVQNHLPLTVEQWGKVQMHEGDLIHTYLGFAQSATGLRDATFVQYELLVDVQWHQRKANPVFRRDTFFGRLERTVAFTLRPSPQLNITEETTFILADILPCQTIQDQYGFYEYSSYGTREVINLNAIRAVVGRIHDRGKWVIVRRKGGIEHAHYTSEEDTIDELSSM